MVLLNKPIDTDHDLMIDYYLEQKANSIWREPTLPVIPVMRMNINSE